MNWHAPAFALDIPGTVGERIPTAHLQGTATLRHYGLPRYTASLYVGAAGSAATHPTSQPFALDLAYARGFRGAALQAELTEEMDDMRLTRSTAISAWGRQFAKMLPNVVRGDHLTMIFTPGAETRFYHNGDFLGAIDGEDFARAFLALWFDARSPAPGLSAALLGRSD